MPEKSILTKKEIEFLEELEKLNIPYMMVGLSAAALQGAPVVTQDIDLWLKNISDPKFQECIKKFGGTYVPPMEGMQNAPGVVGECFEFIDFVMNMSGLESFDDELRHAKSTILEGVEIKLLPLERIIHSKKKAGRQKDQMALPALEAALAAIKAKEN